MVSFGDSTISTLAFWMSPSMRSFGLSPAVMCKSDASRSIISSRSERKLIDDGAGAGDVMASIEWEVGTALPHRLASGDGGKNEFKAVERLRWSIAATARWP